MSSKQVFALRFIASNPGCTTADVCRAEWSGRGHSATYDRIKRLINRGFVTRKRFGTGFKLTITTSGIVTLALRGVKVEVENG